MIDATHLKARRTAARPLKVELYLMYRRRGGLTTKLQVVRDGGSYPVLLYLTEDQASDHKGAAAMVETLPPGCTCLRIALQLDRVPRRACRMGITSCVPPHAKHRIQHSSDPFCIGRAKRSKTFLLVSRTGAASTRDTNGALRPSSRQSPSPPRTYSRSINEP